MNAKRGKSSAQYKLFACPADTFYFDYLFRLTNFMFNNAMDMVGFVDGHVSYIKMYCKGWGPMAISCKYDPPAEYDYQWSEN